MNIEVMFSNFGSLFKLFGWYSLLLIVGTVAIMFPINLLWKHLMKKDELSRLRKTVSFISVYVVALAIIVAFTALVSHGNLYDYGYISGSTLALGFCAQVLWELIKLVRDYGFNKVVKLIAEKTNWNKLLKQFGKKYNIDTKLVDIVATEIEDKYLKNTDTTELEVFEKDESEIILDIHNKLGGFVETGKLDEIASGVLLILKESWGYKPKQETVEENTVEEITENTETKVEDEYIEIK